MSLSSTSNTRRGLILFLGLLGVGTIVTSILPPSFDVERRTLVAAGPAKIQRYLIDLPTWAEWTAWNREADPQAEMSFEGKRGDPGQIWTWNGPEIGTGRIALTGIQGVQGVEFLLEAGSVASEGSIRLSPSREGTEVVWRARGDLPHVMRWLGIKIDGDLGADFDRGLTELKERVESARASQQGG